MTEDPTTSPFPGGDGSSGAGGAGDGGGFSFSSTSPSKRLFDGRAPGPSVGELQQTYGLSRGWAVFTRGCSRVAIGPGIPPIVEIGMGGAAGMWELMKGGDVTKALPGASSSSEGGADA